MPKFRKKPVVVDAVRFDPAGEHKTTLPPGVTGVHSPGADNWGYMGCTFFVRTAGGYAEVFAGDWIIAEQDGRGHYPCRPDIFAATYDPA